MEKNRQKMAAATWAWVDGSLKGSSNLLSTGQLWIADTALDIVVHVIVSPVPWSCSQNRRPASNCTVTQSGYLVFKRRWCVSQLPLHSEGGPSQPWKTQTNMCHFGLFSLKTDMAHSGLAPLSLVCREETGRQWSYPELCHLSHEAHFWTQMRVREKNEPILYLICRILMSFSSSHLE